MGKESELLLACLASKGVLNKSQTDRLLMCANADQRMEDLFKIMLTLPNRDTFEVFVSVLEENGDNVAADILRRDRSRPKLQLKEEYAEDALPLQGNKIIANIMVMVKQVNEQVFSYIEQVRACVYS